MPAPVPTPVRQQIWELFSVRGLAPGEIARRLHLPLRTVQALLRRFTDSDPPAFQPAYPPRTDTPSALIDEALTLRLDHPTWGAGRIRVELQLRYPDVDTLPSTRTIERWCQRKHHPPAPPGRRPKTSRPRSSYPHEVWEVDAAEQKRLATREQVSWLRLVDDFCGAVLGTRVFPPRLLHAGAGHAGPG